MTEHRHVTEHLHGEKHANHTSQTQKSTLNNFFIFNTRILIQFSCVWGMWVEVRTITQLTTEPTDSHVFHLEASLLSVL